MIAFMGTAFCPRPPTPPSDHRNPLFMNHRETQKLIAAVDDLTGHRVSVDTIDGIQEDARMISARPGSSVHTVKMFNMLNPTLHGGIDLSREYAHARKLAGV